MTRKALRPGGTLDGRSSVPEREQPWAQHPGTRGALLLLRYLDLVDKYETPSRMIRAHMHKMLGDWLQVGCCSLVPLLPSVTTLQLLFRPASGVPCCPVAALTASDQLYRASAVHSSTNVELLICCLDGWGARLIGRFC